MLADEHRGLRDIVWFHWGMLRTRAGKYLEQYLIHLYLIASLRWSLTSVRALMYSARCNVILAFG